MNPYERPSDKWICGHAADGQPCRIGPSRWGRCRATFECDPVKVGARWKCTRPKSAGGPCADGPLPDGTCCRPIPRCQPVRSLRSRRGVVTWATAGLTTGLLLLALFSGWRDRWLLPGELSAPHAGPNFHQAAQRAGIPGDCVACHAPAAGGPAKWLEVAWRSDWFPARSAGPQPMDVACQKCHTHHDFHAANMPRPASCSACHLEHQGPGAMTAPPPAHCVACHGDAAALPAGAPLISEFSRDHPEFQFRRENQRDTNTLKFNHQRHFAEDIPAVNGERLTCATCHKPDVSGIRHEPVTFAAHCQSCHSLQFDARNPDLHLPHGDPLAVRAFLNSLPTQYADLARRKGVADVEGFVVEQLRQLRDQRTDFEHAAFFSADWGPPAAVAGVTGLTRAPFPGCVKCHEVQPGTSPVVTRPVAAQRWLWRGEFNHATHRAISCAECHPAQASRRTSDLILPGKDTCASCHGAQGGVAGSCITCHNYHREARDLR